MPYKDKNKEKITRRKFYQNNKEKILNKRKKYYLNNKEKIIEYQKKLYLVNKEKILKQQYEYICKNREIRNLAAKKRYYKKMKDPSFRVIQSIRARVRGILRGTHKSKASFKYLGVPNVEFFWKYLEKLFKPGMTRENYGLWEIDHIKAVSAFDRTNQKQIQICFNYKNCQPMWSLENKKKGNK